MRGRRLLLLLLLLLDPAGVYGRYETQTEGARERETEDRMATLVESAEMETLGGQSNTGASPTSSGPSQHFNDGKFYLLVVIGEIVTEDHLKCAIADIERGRWVGGWVVGHWESGPHDNLHRDVYLTGVPSHVVEDVDVVCSGRVFIFLFVRASEPITHYYRVISDMSFIIWVPA